MMRLNPLSAMLVWLFDPETLYQHRTAPAYVYKGVKGDHWLCRLVGHPAGCTSGGWDCRRCEKILENNPL